MLFPNGSRLRAYSFDPAVSCFVRYILKTYTQQAEITRTVRNELTIAIIITPTEEVPGFVSRGAERVAVATLVYPAFSSVFASDATATSRVKDTTTSLYGSVASKRRWGLVVSKSAKRSRMDI
jgi:hypothetical protein